MIDINKIILFGLFIGLMYIIYLYHQDDTSKKPKNSPKKLIPSNTKKPQNINKDTTSLENISQLSITDLQTADKQESGLESLENISLESLNV